jgi:hypothetical protein
MARRATLGFVPMSIGWRLIGGALLAMPWTVSAVAPVARAAESDVPGPVWWGLMFVVAITPALLALRRQSLAATIAWDDESITHFLGGRVKTAIAWKDATLRTSSGGTAPRRIQIADAEGRSIWLAEGEGLATLRTSGRHFIASHDADALLATAARLRRPIHEGSPPRADGVLVWLFVVAGSYAAAINAYLFVGTGTLTSWPMMLICGGLLAAAMRRVVQALGRSRPTEWIAFDGDELGLARARRLDGERVLVDLAPAHHPDALVATRRGFVGATLRERLERPSSPYRSGEPVLEAVNVETQADRVLRFERLRTAFVDVFAYGGLFAMAVAAVLVS